jgi:hypothetical protein
VFQPKGRLLALPAMIRLDCTGSQGTNTPAYLSGIKDKFHNTLTTE